MKIGVVGTGNIGGTIAKKLRAAGHDVRVANDGGVEGVRAFALENDLMPKDIHGVVLDTDVVVLAVPTSAIGKLPSGLFSKVAEQVIVIDTSNYYPDMRDERIEAIDSGLPESEWVQSTIGRSVTKAFNTALADTLADLGKPEGEPNRIAIAVAGDIASHKEAAMKLVNQTGFDPVDAGSLADSWRQQPATPAYCCDYTAPEMIKALAKAVPGVAQVKRDRLPELFASLGDNPTHAQIIAMNRKVNAI